MILCDTRERKNEHILQYFKDHNVEFEIRKLDVGDYMDTDSPCVTVDRKQNLDELAHNLCSRDDLRFWREIRRSKANGLKMVVLCEHGGRIHSIEDVAGWRSKYARITGRRLRDEMLRAHISYGVEFLFCDKRVTARRILELLGYEAR